FLDRPHRLRLDAFYVTRFGLSFGSQFVVRSGAPLNKLGYLNQYWGSAIQLVPRGSAGRLPTEWEANLTVSYPVHIGPMTATVQVYAYNLFNNQIATFRDTVWSSNAPHDWPASIYDPNQDQSNENYGKVTSRQDPRSLRAAVKVSF
ncbi:MAG: hypothetical protein ABR610_04865, partial [Thermoanaerobaculia bacterium]